VSEPVVTVVPLEEAGLVSDPDNARVHNPRNIGVIEDSMNTDGAGRSIFVDQDNVTVAGAGALEAALQAGIKHAAIVETDGDTLVVVKRTLTPEQRTRLALADNRAQELSTWNEQKIKELHEAGDEALKGLWTEKELVKFLANVHGRENAGQGDPDDVPAERPSTVTRGDVYALGAHRLMCGDSTQPDDVARLLNGQEPDVIISDPPYCSGGFQEAGRASGSIGTRGEERIANDTLSTRGYIALMKSAIGLLPAKAIYVFTDWRMWINLFDVAESSGFGVRNMLVWDKETPGMGVGWRMQHELVLVGVRVTAPFDPHKAEGNVLKAKRTGNPLHPTQKPVDLLETMLEVTNWAHVIADPFGGSGTTLIACESKGREARVMELSPGFCQVIIDRWETFTGEKAVKL
jgi:DNA modification methylase